MFSKAQASLEYLMTYGWALVLIATLVGALVFVFGTPKGPVFSSSDPIRILMRGGVVSGSNAEIRLQNITGGQILISDVELPPGYDGCSLNGVDTDGISLSDTVPVIGGGQILISCTNVTDPQSGPIRITYSDQVGLTRVVNITGGGMTGPAPIDLCGNGELDGGEWCDGDLGLSDPPNMECNANCSGAIVNNCTVLDTAGSYELAGNLTNVPQDCISITESDISLDCVNYAISSALGQVRGLPISGAGTLSNIQVSNCTIEDFGTINMLVGDACGVTLNNLTIQNGFIYGLNVANLSTPCPVTLNNVTSCNNGTDMEFGVGVTCSDITVSNVVANMAPADRCYAEVNPSPCP